MNAKKSLHASVERVQTITAESTGRKGGGDRMLLGRHISASATDAYPKATHYTVFREAAFNPRSNPKTGLPGVML